MAETSFGRPGGFYSVGVVVNVEDDPTQSGQVKVKWYEGSASQDRLQEHDLPWTRVMFPPTNPSLGQAGGPHTGLRVGSIVYGQTVDGAGQEYIVVGSSPKIGQGEFDQEAKFDSDIPQSAKVQSNGKQGGSETQPRWGDVNAIVTQKSIVKFGESEGGKFRQAAKFADIDDSIGLIDNAITA
jgi:hypothetical protein